MESQILSLLSKIRSRTDCSILQAKGLPDIGLPLALPDDLAEFYSHCGGVELFREADYAVSILPPDLVVPANPVIVGQLYSEDISSTWFLIATDGHGEYITIDLAPGRLGRCYDSFSETHAVAGSCSIVAASFTELLQRLYENDGERWYWLQPEFQSLGDAYD